MLIYIERKRIMKLTGKLLGVSIVLGALFASEAMAAKIEIVLPTNKYVKTAGEKLSSTGGKYRIGTEVYDAGTHQSTGGYFYIGADSFYAANSLSNQHSTVATEQMTTREATMAQIGMIHNHLDNSSVGAMAPTGGNGGCEGKRWSVLARFNWTNMKEDVKRAEWKANIYSFALGGDYKVNELVKLGLAFTYSYLDGDTAFNRGTMRDQAFGVVPFARIKATKWLAFDVLGGYSRVEKKRTRKLQFSDNPALNGVQVQGTPKSDRWFGAAYANLTHSINKLNLLARFGYSHSEDKQKAFTENNGDRYTSQTVKNDAGHVRLQAAYAVTRMFEPGVFGTYDYVRSSENFKDTGVVEPSNTNPTITRNPNLDSARSKNVFGGGVLLNIRASDRVSGGVEYGYKQSKDLKIHSVDLKVKYAF
jgi:hypothetical protein